MQTADVTLIKHSKNGDTDAFEQLVKRYENKVYNLVYRFIGNHVDAYDVAQETWVYSDQSYPLWQGEIDLATCP